MKVKGRIVYFDNGCEWVGGAGAVLSYSEMQNVFKTQGRVKFGDAFIYKNLRLRLSDITIAEREPVYIVLQDGFYTKLFFLYRRLLFSRPVDKLIQFWCRYVSCRNNDPFHDCSIYSRLHLFLWSLAIYRDT